MMLNPDLKQLYVPSDMTDLGYKIFLDRYALKRQDKENLQEGDLVLVKAENGQKEVGHIMEFFNPGTNAEMVNVKLMEGDTGVSYEVLKGVPLDHVDWPQETEPIEMWTRVSAAVSTNESDENQHEWMEKFIWLLDDWKFVPGGRILAAAGTDSTLTYYNCYVIPSPKDSKTGIFETLDTMAQIMSRGGGVGINLSSLRPRYAHCASTNGRSSGAVSWGEVYSFVTGLIEQGGSRRGALMLILDDWHPDIEEFITVKKNMERITNANISVAVSDAFMEAVKEDRSWNLVFPDTSCAAYDEEWDGDIKKWMLSEQKTHPMLVHKTIKARDLWNQIIESAWSSAEPGVWFKDRSNAYSNSWYHSPLICTNPCGEQALPAWGVCNLGAINLAKFVYDESMPDWESNAVDWATLEKTVQYAVRFLDNVVDVTPYHFPENKKQQKKERRLGLGTMGLAEMLIKLKIRYGSEECLEFVNKLYGFIAETAYEASIELAKEKGPFLAIDSGKYFTPSHEQFLESHFMLRMPAHIKRDILEHGIRNVTLLTQAPTGTTGTMVNTSTGIEPFYYWEYERKGRLGSHTERVAVYEEWIDNNASVQRNNGKKEPLHKLPDYFVTAQDLTPKEHVQVQAAIQRWVDSSISKTSNLPSYYTVEQTKELYELMYELGCKGGTVYRDGSRDEQILSIKEEPEEDNSTWSCEDVSDIVIRLDAQDQLSKDWRKRPVQLPGKTYRKQTPVGVAYITITANEDGPFEVFVTIGRAGSELAAEAEAIGRLASLTLRMPSHLSPFQRMERIIAQLQGIGSGRHLGFGKNRVMSLPDGIAQTLLDYLQSEGVIQEKMDITQDLLGMPEENGAVGDICPSCGEATFVRIEGCQKCDNCGHSEC